MTVYLLHFDQRYRHAQHYLGWAADNGLDARLARHLAGTGSRLCAVAIGAGITWQVARVWPDGDRTLERRLKRWHGSAALCPICKAQAP
jgi:hypothetical protein